MMKIDDILHRFRMGGLKDGRIYERMSPIRADECMMPDQAKEEIIEMLLKNELRRRPVQVHSHQFFAQGYLLAIGTGGDGWILVEHESGRVYKYDLAGHSFNFVHSIEKGHCEPEERCRICQPGKGFN